MRCALVSVNLSVPSLRPAKPPYARFARRARTFAAMRCTLVCGAGPVGTAGPCVDGDAVGHPPLNDRTGRSLRRIFVSSLCALITAPMSL